MSTVLDVVVPLFGLMLLGFAAARLGWFDREATRGLSLFVFNVVVPALLFRSMARAELPDTPPWDLLLSYYPATLAVFAGGIAVAALNGRRGAARAIVGFGAGFGNTVLMGIPLTLTAFGQDAALPLFLILAVHSPLLLTLLTLLIEVGREPRRQGNVWRDILRGLAGNPILPSLFAGLAVNLAGWTLPGPLDALTAVLAAAAMPCALFAMGAALSQYRIAGNLREALALVALKNLLHPLLVWLLAVHVFELPPLWARTATLIAALPSGVNAYLFAQRYQTGVATVTTEIFLSTAVAILTLSVTLALLLR